MKDNKNRLKYTLYIMVPYNISPIQAGIQALHAACKYVSIEVSNGSKEAKKWAENDYRTIILNGGTTNNDIDNLGTLQLNRDELIKNGIKVHEFYEPDINNALTAICFLVDERVYNLDTYPNFEIDMFDSIIEKEERYKDWVDNIGGEPNVFLRSFLPKFKLI